MWARALVGFSVAGSFAALRLPETEDERFRDPTEGHESPEPLDVPDEPVPANETWRHEGPRDEWKLWLRYPEPPPKLGAEFQKRIVDFDRGGKPDEPMPPEYYGRRNFKLSFVRGCGVNESMRSAPPQPADSWIVTNVQTPTLVPYVVPRDQPNRRDVSVILVPGGGGELLAWDAEGVDTARWLNSEGISAFIFKYRIPARNFREMDLKNTMDVQRAMSLVKYSAGELGLNSKKIGIMGFSHGARPALLCSAAKERLYKSVDAADGSSDTKPAFTVLLYPEVVGGIWPERDTDYDLLFSVQSRFPPTFASLSEDDPCIPPDYTMGWLNRVEQGKVEQHVYPRGKHGYSTCIRTQVEKVRGAEACRWVDRALEFMDRIVGTQRESSVLKAYKARRELLLHKKQTL